MYSLADHSKNYHRFTKSKYSADAITVTFKIEQADAALMKGKSQEEIEHFLKLMMHRHFCVLVKRLGGETEHLKQDDWWKDQ